MWNLLLKEKVDMIRKGMELELGELEELLDKIDECTSPTVLKKLGVSLTYELQEARDIALMALKSIKRIIETTSILPEEISVEINEINARLKEEIKQRQNMTNAEINKIKNSEPRKKWWREDRIH